MKLFGARPHLPIGSMVRVLPNHACSTSAQHRSYVVVKDGSNQVHGHWPRFEGTDTSRPITDALRHPGARLAQGVAMTG
jgi:hypothetical protein